MTFWRTGRGRARAAWLAASSITAAAVLFLQSPVAGQGGKDHSQPTFTKDIAPILQRSCQNCHRPDSVAPMSLLTYEEARPYAAAIKRRTSIRNKQGTMPPWYIEKDIGIQHYKNDISLSDEEIAKIARVGRQRRAARQSRRHAAAAARSPTPTRGRSARRISSSRRRRSA